MSKLKYASFTLTLRQPYAAEIAALRSWSVDLFAGDLIVGMGSSNDPQLSGPVRDTPPYRAIPFRDIIAEGGIAPICLVFIGYHAGIAEIPLLRGGVSHLHFACSPMGKRSEKGEGVSHPIGHAETPKTP